MVRRTPQPDADPFALQVCDCSDGLMDEQLETSGMHTGEHRDGQAGVQSNGGAYDDE